MERTFDVRRLGCLTITALVAGCAPTTHADAPGAAGTPRATWTAPAWMTDQAEQRARFVRQLQACMDNAGWDRVMDDSAGFTEPFTSMDELTRAGADRDACLVAEGIDPSTITPDNLTDADLAVMYDQDLDTYACLVAHDIARRTDATFV